MQELTLGPIGQIARAVPDSWPKPSGSTAMSSAWQHLFTVSKLAFFDPAGVGLTLEDRSIIYVPETFTTTRFSTSGRTGHPRGPAGARTAGCEVYRRAPHDFQAPGRSGRVADVFSGARRRSTVADFAGHAVGLRASYAIAHVDYSGAETARLKEFKIPS